MLLISCISVIPFALGGADPEGEPVSRVGTPVSEQITPPDYGQSLDESLAELAAVYPGTYGVAIFDPSSGREFGVNESETFDAASLAKLPVMLTFYKEVAAGRIELDEEISIRPSDMQTYGTGVLKDRSVGYTMTLEECAEVMIRESDNTAWVMLERRLGKDRISRELSTLGADGTNYKKYTTTPEDILTVLRAISDPRYTSPDLSRKMLASMTGTAYEGRIPDVLPDDARVAHKIGTLGNTYSDAGIVYTTPGSSTNPPKTGEVIS